MPILTSTNLKKYHLSTVGKSKVFPSPTVQPYNMTYMYMYMYITTT